jgi:hypothetical protein
MGAMTGGRGTLVVLAVVAVAPLVVAVAASAKTAKAPKIVLSTDSAMVNTTVVVKGKHLTPDTTYTVAVCGKTEWSLPANPCADGNQTVQTNDRGAFKTKIAARLCPQDSPPTITEETCYVGILHPTGIDTLALDPAAPLEVSWP